jgi:hypothetical protein
MPAFPALPDSFYFTHTGEHAMKHNNTVSRENSPRFRSLVKSLTAAVGLALDGGSLDGVKL